MIGNLENSWNSNPSLRQNKPTYLHERLLIYLFHFEFLLMFMEYNLQKYSVNEHFEPIILKEGRKDRGIKYLDNNINRR